MNRLSNSAIKNRMAARRRQTAALQAQSSEHESEQGADDQTKYTNQYTDSAGTHSVAQAGSVSRWAGTRHRQLWSVEVSWLRGGLIVGSNGSVVFAHPILRWTVGQPITAVQQWALKHRGHAAFIERIY